MNLDDFLNSFHDSNDSIMGTKTFVGNSQTFPVVENLASKSKDGAEGGLEPNVQNVVTAQPKHVVNPYTFVNKKCTVDGVNYRVYSVEVGTVAIHFTLIDPNAAR